MAITFKCEHCRKNVKAPDSAAGKRGKCPHCGQSNYIPAPVSADDEIPLAPVNEAEERRRQQEIRELIEKERDVIAQTGGDVEPPLQHRDDLAPEDLYHLVVNYCLDLLNSKLQRAKVHVAKLKQYPGLARTAVADFLDGKATEEVLEGIPKRVLKGFLTQLRDELQ